MNLLETLQNFSRLGKIVDVQPGPSRVAVLAETPDGLQCGLAAALTGPGQASVLPDAAWLASLSSQELVDLTRSADFGETAVGLAALNALLPLQGLPLVELNAEDYLVRIGAGKKVVVVGHFPFIERLRGKIENVWCLELEPRPGDLPADAAPEIIPLAEVIAITATTLINQTFDGLIKMASPGAQVMLLGPSAPLSPLLFQFGVQIICGTVAVDPWAALDGIRQGIPLRQLRRAGIVRHVTLFE